jgi:hypothetical protein
MSVTHALHVPAKHTPPGHGEPGGRFEPPVQEAVPDPHISVLVTQGLPPGLQVIPVTHALHVPSLHTPPEQGVPGGALDPAGHVDVPVAHEVVLTKHGLPPGLHVTPAWHVVAQPPSMQTMLVPQGVPFSTPASPRQIDVPDLHDVVPVKQRLPPGLQEAPVMHFSQPPSKQTIFVPHVVPSVAVCPVSVQMIPPSAHETAPT